MSERGGFYVHDVAAVTSADCCLCFFTQEFLMPTSHNEVDAVWLL